MNIYKVEGGYAISINGSWIAGCFECEEAAKYAINFTDAELQALQDVKKSQPITLKDLKKNKDDSRTINTKNDGRGNT